MCDLTDLAVVDNIFLVEVGKLSYRGNDSRSTAAPRFFKLACLKSINKLVDRKKSLADLKALIAKDLKAGFTRNTGKDRAVKLGRYYLAVDLEHNVHCTDLFDILAVNAVKPEHLRISLFLSLLARTGGCTVVTAALGEAGSALDRTNVL